MVNVNLGAPYEALIKRIIGRGYAGSQVEVIRQALRSYEREVEKEEVELVYKAVESEVDKVRSGKVKLVKGSEVMKKAGL